jgi:hypothetical protein
MLSKNEKNFSCYPLYANQTLDNCSNDIPANRNPMFPLPVSYRINSSGFRGDDFIQHPDIMALGCSITFGVGMPEHLLWHSLLGNYTVANVSKPGASADTCYRLAQYWIPVLKPKRLIYLEPPPGRFEILRDKVYLPEWCSYETPNGDSVWDMWAKNMSNFELNYTKNLQAIQWICLNNNVECITLVADDIEYIDLPLEKAARDGTHPGIECHQELAQKIKSLGL